MDKPISKDIYWTIIKEVRRRRDKRCIFLYPNQEAIPDWYYSYYDSHNLDTETHELGRHWSMNDDKLYYCTLIFRDPSS